MAFIDLWNGQDLGGEGNELIEESIEKWNKPPNLVRAFALNPSIFVGEDFWTNKLMNGGLLSRKFKEMIATTVSSTNRCLYCTSAHSFAMAQTNTSKEKVEAVINLNFELFETKEIVALEFAKKSTLNSKSITQEDINGLRIYFSDPEIVEIGAVIMAFMGYNTFVEIMGLEVDNWMDRQIPNVSLNH